MKKLFILLLLTSSLNAQNIDSLAVINYLHLATQFDTLHMEDSPTLGKLARLDTDFKENLATYINDSFMIFIDIDDSKDVMIRLEDTYDIERTYPTFRHLHYYCIDPNWKLILSIPNQSRIYTNTLVITWAKRDPYLLNDDIDAFLELVENKL